MMDLPTLLKLVEESWPARYERGRVTHVHKNDVELPDGSRVHLRVLVQTVSDPVRSDDFLIVTRW